VSCITGQVFSEADEANEAVKTKIKVKGDGTHEDEANKAGP